MQPGLGAAWTGCGLDWVRAVQDLGRSRVYRQFWIALPRVSLTSGALTLSLRVQEATKKKKDDTEYLLVTEGREDAKLVFTARWF